MSTPIPKQSLPAFLYTSEGSIVIDVEPDSSFTTSTAVEAGMLIAFSSAATLSGGYNQGQEVTVIKGKYHDPTYTDAATLKFLGVSTIRDPVNHMIFQDVAGNITVEDRTIYADTFAGGLRRFPVLVSEGIVLVRFWDTVNNQAASLANTDVFKDVYASVTDGTALTTGKAGYATLDTNSTAKVPIGTLVAVPIVGSDYGYVKLEPSRAR